MSDYALTLNLWRTDAYRFLLLLARSFQGIWDCWSWYIAWSIVLSGLWQGPQRPGKFLRYAYLKQPQVFPRRYLKEEISGLQILSENDMPLMGNEWVNIVERQSYKELELWLKNKLYHKGSETWKHMTIFASVRGLEEWRWISSEHHGMHNQLQAPKASRRRRPGARQVLGKIDAQNARSARKQKEIQEIGRACSMRNAIDFLRAL